MVFKLCYIFTSAGLSSSSVQTKVIAQINALNACGVVCRGVFFSSEVKEKLHFNEYIDFIPYEKSNWKYFNLIKQNISIIKAMSKFVATNIGKDELIYIRYPGASFRLYKFSKFNKGRIISEHISQEIGEILSTRNEFPLGLSPSKLLSYFLYQIWPIYNEIIWGTLYRKNLKFIVSESNELAVYQKSRGGKTVFVNPNGLEIDNYQVRQNNELDKELIILFLKGTTGIATWNGLDRLIKSIDNFKSNSIKIQLIICGIVIPNEIPERDYIIKKGYMDSNELDQLFSSVHIGFSTLCLYRKKLNEAAVLKAREYIARGLPFVYGYDDPDIKLNDPVSEFLLRVPNNDSIIDFNEVIEFAKRVTSDPYHPQKMRVFAEEKLDWKVKMNKLKEYIFN